MKYTLLLLYLLFYSISNCALAQNEVDNRLIIRKLLSASDSGKIILYEKLYNGYFYSKLDKALDFAQKGYDLSNSKNDFKSVANFSNKIGSVYLLQSKFSSSLIYFLKAIKLSEDYKFSQILSDSYNKIALTYYAQENYPKALEYFFNYLNQLNANKDRVNYSKTCNNIGEVYKKEGIYNKALDYYYKALKANEDINDLKEVSSSYNNIGNIYTIQKKTSSAFEYYFKSLEILKKLKDTVLTVTILNNIGAVYEKRKDYYRALTYYFDALEMVEKVKDKTGMAFCLHNMANTYAKVNEIENALDYETESYGIAKEIGSREYIRSTSLGLSEIYAKLNNFKKAFEFHKIYSAYKDSILNEKNVSQIDETIINYETERKEKEIELLKREQLLLKQRNEIQTLTLSKKSLLIYALVLIIFLVCVLVLVLINRINLKKRINDHLENKVKERTSSLELAINELYKTNNELDNFIYRSSHDLSGPLATLAGLCNVALLDVRDPNSLLYFNKLKEVITRMTNLLYLIIDIGNIKHHILERSSFNLKTLVEVVLGNINMPDILSNIKIRLDIPENFKIETDQKMLEVVLYNILKNAIEYSIPLKYNHQPYVNITLKDTTAFLEISIADNGYGIPTEFSDKIFDMFFKGTNQSSGFGLGLYKAKNAIQKLGGEISLNNLNPNHKTIFIISIPQNGKSLKPYFSFDFNFKNIKQKASSTPIKIGH